ncbi:MAG: hypothetical protein QOK08_853, partial [Actinomycetota bacterium]|nr:hypothetical protein [Actinomycetota bacterium]
AEVTLPAGSSLISDPELLVVGIVGSSEADLGEGEETTEEAASDEAAASGDAAAEAAAE